jgi:hypothetical protein
MDSHGSRCDAVVEQVVNIQVLQDVEIFMTIIRSGCLWSGKSNGRQEMCVVKDYMRVHASCVTSKIRVRVKSEHEPCLKVLPRMPV